MQNRKSQPYAMATVAVVVLILMIGCASTQKEESRAIERLLVNAGFEKHPADTPEKLDKLKAMTQRKIIHYQHESTAQYVYADAEYCICLYTGSEEAYQRYQQLALQRQISEEQRRAEERNKPADIDWGDFDLKQSW